MSRHSLIALAFLSLPLVACTDAPPPEPVELRPLGCGRVGCGPEVPVVAGGTVAYQAEPAGLAAGARTSDASIATIADGAAQDPDGWTVTALRPGTVTLELLDDDQRVIATRTVQVAAADHLEAQIKIVQGLQQTVLDRVGADVPQEVPARSHVLMWVDPFAGDTRLLGALPYHVTAQLSGGTTLEQDVEAGTALRIGYGPQAVTFTAGALSSRFVLQAR